MTRCKEQPPAGDYTVCTWTVGVQGQQCPPALWMGKVGGEVKCTMGRGSGGK